MKTQSPFFSQISGDETLEITLRDSGFSYWVIISLVFCVFLISVARLRQREVFVILLQGTVFFRSQSDQLKDGIRQNPFSGTVLLIQFACITSLSIFWLNSDYLTHWTLVQQISIIAFPVALFLYNVIVSTIASYVSNVPRLIPEINHITFGLTQSLGIVILIEFFILFFKPEYKSFGNLVLLSTFGLFFFLRLIRGIYIGIQQGVNWYYLILYFWTLEILPVLILAKLLFNQEFSGIIG